MESGNSSSMQSSSGGAVGDDQEYESTAGNNSFFLQNTTQQQYSNSSLQQYMFSANNPQQTYLDNFGDQSSFQNLMFWQQQQQQQQQNQQQQKQNQQQFGGDLIPPPPNFVSGGSSSAANFTSTTKPSTSTDPGPGSSSGAVGASGQKNPRKRTRASRRAPTTVLTTDTSNFRAMVQEFTGIPSSPFSAAASPLLSRRLTDLFAGSSSSGPAFRPSVGGGNSNLERLLSGYNSNYPYRPAPQKPPLINPPSSSTNPATSLLMNINTSTINTAPPNPGLNLPNSILSSSNNNLPFQSLLQSGTAAGILSGSGTNFHDLGGVIGSDQMFLAAATDPTMSGGGFPPPPPWRDGPNEDDNGGGGANVERNNSNNNNDDDASNQKMEGTISGSGTSNYQQHNHVNVNMNCGREKGLDNSTPRGGTTGGQGTLGHFLD